MLGYCAHTYTSTQGLGEALSNPRTWIFLEVDEEVKEVQSGNIKVQ
jgi:hypothetical protein